MDPDYLKKYEQIYKKTEVDNRMMYDPASMKSVSATNAAQSAHQKVMVRKSLVKEALLLLAKYKNTRLLLDDLTAQEAWGPMDPVGYSTSYILRLVDADKRYMKEMLGDWSNVKDTMLMLINESDFEPQYTPTDYELGIKREDYDIKTLVTVRVAAKIFLAWQNANK